MATTSMDYEAANGDRYEGQSFFVDVDRPDTTQADQTLTSDRVLDEAPRYERDNRSASPRPLRDDPEGGRRRSASPGAGDRYVLTRYSDALPWPTAPRTLRPWKLNN